MGASLGRGRSRVRGWPSVTISAQGAYAYVL